VFFYPLCGSFFFCRRSYLILFFYFKHDSVDLDGDGFTELTNSNSPGFGITFGGENYYTFSVLLNTPDGVALETVLEIETDLQYWEELTGLEGITSIEALVEGYFDVDRDGLPDALMLLRASTEPALGFQQYTGFFWYRNQLTPPGDRIAGDVNNDGLVNGADLTIVLSDWTD
jgi:hypothetical protein